MTDGQMKMLRAMFSEAAAQKSAESPFYIARLLGADAKQLDSLANEIALWAISFCTALERTA